jgi:hypothetical protein
MALGNPIHNGRVALTGSKCAHLFHDFLGVAASECRNACFSSGVAGWQPEHAEAPTGGSNAPANAAVTDNRTVAAGTKAGSNFMAGIHRASGRPLVAWLRIYANCMLWFLSGNERTRLPVALKKALSTAGAATQIVGSPTPPQKPPLGITMDSTLGIWAIRIES